jgi:hypothetical protein
MYRPKAVQECYVILSHKSLALFRTLEFVGSIAFNVCMAGSAALSVLIYERVGETAPFYAVAACAGVMAAVVFTYFFVRLHGRLGTSFATAESAILEAALLAQRRHQGDAKGPVSVLADTIVSVSMKSSDP